MQDKCASLLEVGIEGVGRVFLREGTSDAGVFEQIYTLRELDVTAAPQFSWVRNEYEKLITVNEVPLIVDCGANIGLSCLFLSTLFPKARVVGIEPARDNIELALKNTAGRTGIEIIEGAVHDQVTALEIVDPLAEKCAYQVREARDQTATETVESVTINSIMQRFAAQRSLIVKVDIEGGERSLFRSNIGWLDRTDLLIIETHDWLFPGQGTSRNLFCAIAGRRFEIIQRGEYLFFFFQ